VLATTAQTVRPPSTGDAGMRTSSDGILATSLAAGLAAGLAGYGLRRLLSP
jgi:hypothetical protein